MIEDYLPKSGQPLDMHSFLHFDNIQSATEEIQKAIEFLRKKFDFIYQHDLYQPCPFSPMAMFDGKRSLLPADLSDDDLNFALSLIEITESHAIRAKIYDVVGCCRKDKQLIIQAADEYYQNFLEHIDGEHPSKYIPPLKRSLYLLSQNGQKKLMEQRLDEILSKGFASKTMCIVLAHFLSEFVLKYANNKLPETISYVKKTIEENNDEPILLDIIDSLLSYVNNLEKQEWVVTFVEIAKKAAIRTTPHGYQYLERAAAHVDKESDLFSELKFLSEEEQKKLYKSMNMQPVSIHLSKENEAQIENFRKNNIELLQSLPDGATQFAWLLAHFKAFSIEEIETLYEKEKDSLRYLVNNINFNNEGLIEFESSNAAEADKKEKIISDIYNLHTDVVCPLILWPFVNTLKDDLSLTEVILDVIAHNLFVPKERVDVVSEKIMGGLRQKVGDALNYLIPQLEYGFLTYIKEQKHIYPEHKGRIINLNNMLVQKGDSQNRFRKELLEIIDPSLLQQLEYRLCRKLGGNFRNRDFHSGVLSTTQFTLQEAETFFLILLVYCQGYDSDI